VDECDVLCAGDVLCKNQLLSEVSKGVREWGRGGGWVSGHACEGGCARE
jgi:hypothetical protein